MLQGLMQDQPLLISMLIDHAASWHPQTEVVSRSADATLHRYRYVDVRHRAKQVAAALTAFGVGPGDRIATLAWNGHRHLELYYGVSGIGAVLHTVNPRLPVSQIQYIIEHAEDGYVFFDLSLLALIEGLTPHLTNVKQFVAMASREQLRGTSLSGLQCYEDLIESRSVDFPWPSFDERCASSLCYTSGTTGLPKGVLYSHRSTVLHSFAVCAVDGLAISAADSVLVVVPMFHVNAWGIPYAAAMCGAKLVLPGQLLDGESVYELMRGERVTLALGVPTVWSSLIEYVERNGLNPKSDLCLKRVVIGGTAAPRSMIDKFQELFGADVVHAWGMTELSPMGAVCNPLPKHAQWSSAERAALKTKQGRPLFGVNFTITDADGRRLPHDGRGAGQLNVRSPWAAKAYFNDDCNVIVDADGFLITGDIATIDEDGYVHITDRAKDLIKSGGEWISSVALENAACSHVAVAEAAAIAVKHPKWQERPLLIVVAKSGQQIDREEILGFLSKLLPTWWLPNDVVCLDSLPRGATGKLQKSELRERYRNYQLPE